MSKSSEQDSCSEGALEEPVRPGAIFSQPWWLDAVAPGSWDEVTIEKAGKIVARHPFVFEHTRWGDSLGMPYLTQTLGPWIDSGQGKRSKRFAKFKDLAFELIEKLPEFANFNQSFSPEIDNWLPWHWKGFKQTTRYTYILDEISDHDKLFKDLSTNIRTDIRKAEKQVVVEQDDKIDDFLDLNHKVFERQGRVPPYTRDYVERLDEACSSRRQRAVFVARDAQGRAHAGVFLVWDDASAYYLMGGGDPDLRGSGATSLCMWEAIKMASTVSSRFDFEGSMMEPVERFFRAFGGTPTPYHFITKSSLRWQASLFARKSVLGAKSRVRKLYGKG